MVAGSTGAGKTTLTRELQRIGGLFAEIPLINPDVIAQGLAPDVGRRDLAAGRVAIREVRDRIAEGHTFALETTPSGRNHLRQIRAMHAHGFRVHLVYVGISSQEGSINRVQTRAAAGGHWVPLHDVVRRYERSMRALPLVLPHVDRASLYDNSGRRYVHIAELEDGRVVAVFTKPPTWLVRALGHSLQPGQTVRGSAGR